MYSVLTGLNTKCLKRGDPEPLVPAPGVARLYSMRFCPWAERVALTLAIKGIKSEVININLSDKPEWLFKLHPEGKVPILEFDGEITIESSLIPQYLEDRFPNSLRLLPNESFGKFHQKLLVEQLMELAPSFYGLAAAFKDLSLGEEKSAAVKVAFDKAEGLLQDEYFGRDSIGYVDILVLPFFERHHWIAFRGHGPLDATSFPGKKYPKLSKYYSKIMSHPAIKSVVHPLSIGSAVGYAMGKFDYDFGLC